MGSHRFKPDRKVFLLHLHREDLFQVVNFFFPPHGKNTDDLIFVVCRSEEWKALDMVPVKMGEKNIYNMLGKPLGNNVLSQVTNTGSGIQDGYPFCIFAKYPDTGCISAISFKFSATNRQGTPHSIKLDFHGFKGFVKDLKNELLSSKSLAQVPDCALFKVKIFLFSLKDKDHELSPAKTREMVHLKV